jgi:hypothetical protein
VSKNNQFNTFIEILIERHTIKYYISCCGSGAILTPGSGMGKKLGSGSGMKLFFWVKILKFFDADPGTWMEKSRIQDKHPGSATLIISWT